MDSQQKSVQRMVSWDFAGGPVVKNLPVNAGDISSIPGLGRSHLPWNNKARAPQLESSPCLPQLEKSLHSNEDSVQPKINK